MPGKQKGLDKDRGIERPTISDRGIFPRVSVSGSDPIAIQVSRNADNNSVLVQLGKRLGIQNPPSGDSPDDYSKFLVNIGDAMSSFQNRSNNNLVTIYFLLGKGDSWSNLQRNPNLLYRRVTVQNEIQVEEKRLKLEKIASEIRVEKEEEVKAAAIRAEKDASYYRALAQAEMAVNSEADKIIKEVMWWNLGSVHGSYANNRFIIISTPHQVHKDQRRARTFFNSALERQKITRALYDAYHNPGVARLVFQLTPDDMIPEDEQFEEDQSGNDPFVPIDEMEAEINRYDFLRSNYAKQSQEVLKAGIPSSWFDVLIYPTVLATLSVNFRFTPKLFHSLEKLRRIGQLFHVMRFPFKGIRQWKRYGLGKFAVAVEGKVDKELIRMAWRFRYSEDGSRTLVKSGDQITHSEKIWRQNYMSARIRVNGHIIYKEARNIPHSPWHSEGHLAVWIQDLRRELGYKADIQVEQIFTERIPCYHCIRLLDQPILSQTKVFYFVGRGRERAKELFHTYYNISKLEH